MSEKEEEKNSLTKILLAQKLSATDLGANTLIPSDEKLLREAIIETRELYLYASKQKDTEKATTRYLLARLAALRGFLEVFYPEE